MNNLSVNLSEVDFEDLGNFNLNDFKYFYILNDIFKSPNDYITDIAELNSIYLSNLKPYDFLKELDLCNGFNVEINENGDFKRGYELRYGNVENLKNFEIDEIKEDFNYLVCCETYQVSTIRDSYKNMADFLTDFNGDLNDPIYSNLLIYCDYESLVSYDDDIDIDNLYKLEYIYDNINSKSKNYMTDRVYSTLLNNMYNLLGENDYLHFMERDNVNDKYDNMSNLLSICIDKLEHRYYTDQYTI